MKDAKVRVNKFKTTVTRPADVQRKWWIVDAKGQVLGRVATEIAKLLSGKHKVNTAPNVDSGDYVVVINSSEVVVKGKNKPRQKTYYRHSGYPGGLKEITFEKQMKKDSTFPIKSAVRNMLPKNKLRPGMLKRLHVYSGAEHDHEAQKPELYKLSESKVS